MNDAGATGRAWWDGMKGPDCREYFYIFLREPRKGLAHVENGEGVPNWPLSRHPGPGVFEWLPNA
jgi:hypothetical protein